MGLEAGTPTKFSDLDSTWPLSGDPRSEGDDHIRNIKRVLKTTFPSINGVVTATLANLNNTAILGRYADLRGIGATITGSAGNYCTITSWTSSSATSTTAVTATASTGSLTINTTGVYKIDFSVTVQGAAAGALSLGLYKNGSLVSPTQCQISNNAGNVQHHLGASLILSLTAADVLDLRVQEVGGVPGVLHPKLCAVGVG